MYDELNKAIRGLLPAQLAKELKDNIDAVVRNKFNEMNLVTREQFEVQEKVLQRTRMHLTKLEEQVAEMERQQKEM